MNLRGAVPAFACALAVALVCGASVSAASVPMVKKHPKKTHVVARKKPKQHAAKKKAAAAPKPVCLIGQSPQRGNSCTANPLFAKTICASFDPWLQAVAPGFQFPAGTANASAFGDVGCWWTVNGHHQAFSMSVANLTGSSDQSGNKLTPQQAWNYEIQMETQSWDTPDAEVCPDGSKYRVPKQTTVEGYPAFTEDTCPADGAAGAVFVLVGPVQFTAHAWAPQFNLTSAQLVPLVEQLIAKYKQYVPQG